MDMSLWKALDPVSGTGSSTTTRYGHIRPYWNVHMLLFKAWATRLSFLNLIGATWKKPNREEGKSGFLIIRNQQLFSLEMSETVHPIASIFCSRLSVRPFPLSSINGPTADSCDGELLFFSYGADPRLVPIPPG